MVGMASNNVSSEEYFSIGSKVCCKTIFDEDYVGEVLAFDHASRAMLLRQPSSSGNSKLYDISLLNFNYVSEVKVLSECTDEAPELKSLNHQKLRKRLAQESQAKLNMAKASSMGVTMEGRRVFSFIFKTIPQCAWFDQSILVMDEVLVKPPYRPQDCEAKDGKEAKALGHVRKIVEKFHKEQGMSQDKDPA